MPGGWGGSPWCRDSCVQPSSGDQAQRPHCHAPGQGLPQPALQLEPPENPGQANLPGHPGQYRDGAESHFNYWSRSPAQYQQLPLQVGDTWELKLQIIVFLLNKGRALLGERNWSAQESVQRGGGRAVVVSLLSGSTRSENIKKKLSVLASFRHWFIKWSWVISRPFLPLLRFLGWRSANWFFGFLLWRTSPKDIDQFASKWLCLQIPRENLSYFGWVWPRVS